MNRGPHLKEANILSRFGDFLFSISLVVFGALQEFRKFEKFPSLRKQPLLFF